MTTSCSKCFCSQNTCLQVYVCIACILSCLVLGWCTFCIHSFTLLHFLYLPGAISNKTVLQFYCEFHGLTFPFLGQVSASVLHMSFMTWPFHFQEGFQAELYFSLAEELSDQLCSMPHMAGEGIDWMWSNLIWRVNVWIALSYRWWRIWSAFQHSHVTATCSRSCYGNRQIMTSLLSISPCHVCFRLAPFSSDSGQRQTIRQPMKITCI